MPPKLAKASLAPHETQLANQARELYLQHNKENAHKPPAFVVSAPGRVNLIGEHTDYNDGFVLPLALDSMSTVVYGTGHLQTGTGTGPTTVHIRVVSSLDEVVEEVKLTVGSIYPPGEDEQLKWIHYVVGVVVQYLADLPVEGYHWDLAFSIASNVPLAAGLSSSASLEVAVATLLECFLHEDLVYSSSKNKKDSPAVQKALRCQRAENEWARSPCGIMDQLVISAAQDQSLVLIDCRSLELTPVPLKTTPNQPVLLVTNSKVTHSIADGEYGIRRKQCHDAVQGMQAVPLYHVLSLRDATLQDVKDSAGKMDDVSLQRARHVVTENKRVKECQVALKMGLWDRVGELMKASHASLKDDYEVSCVEVDDLVEWASGYEGVYGSRITGGGFGGCTVTLVDPDAVDGLEKHLKEQYQAKYGNECDCFVTRPGPGARVLAIDTNCKP